MKQILVLRLLWQAQLCCWKQFLSSPFPCLIVLSVSVNIDGKQQWQCSSPRIDENMTNSSRTASFWWNCLLGSVLTRLRWFTLVHITQWWLQSIVVTYTSASISIHLHRQTGVVYRKSLLSCVTQAGFRISSWVYEFLGRWTFYQIHSALPHCA